MEKELLYWWGKIFEIIAESVQKRTPKKQFITADCPCEKHIGNITIVIDYKSDGLCEIRVTVSGKRHPRCQFPEKMEAELTREQFLDKVAVIAS